MEPSTLACRVCKTGTGQVFLPRNTTLHPPDLQATLELTIPVVPRRQWRRGLLTSRALEEVPRQKIHEIETLGIQPAEHHQSWLQISVHTAQTSQPEGLQGPCLNTWQKKGTDIKGPVAPLHARVTRYGQQKVTYPTSEPFLKLTGKFLKTETMNALCDCHDASQGLLSLQFGECPNSFKAWSQALEVQVGTVKGHWHWAYYPRPTGMQTCIRTVQHCCIHVRLA